MTDLERARLEAKVCQLKRKLAGLNPDEELLEDSPHLGMLEDFEADTLTEFVSEAESTISGLESSEGEMACTLCDNLTSLHPK